MSNKLGGVEILADSNRGMYIPQHFAEACADRWENIMPDDLEVLLAGPDNPEYWDAWASVLDTAQYMDGDYRYILWQDGDLFAVCNARMTEQERQHIFW